MPALKYTTDGVNWFNVAGVEGDMGPSGEAGPTSAGRNRIMNGDFSVNQRGFTSTTAIAYTFDRWRTSCTAGTTYTNQAAVPGELPSNGKRYMRIATTGHDAINEYAQIAQPIEGVHNLAGKKATVSFWAKSTSGTPLFSVGGSQRFGTGGSALVEGILFGKIRLSTSWERYALTVDIPSITGKTIGTGGDWFILEFWTSAGSNYDYRTGSIGPQNTTIDFCGIQLEEGEVATLYEQRIPSEELRACQRYFQRWQQPPLHGSINSAATSTSRLGMILPVAMRIAPTNVMSGALPVFDGGTAGTITGITVSYNTPTVLEINTSISFTSVGGRLALVYQTGVSYLDLNAEF